MTNRNILLTGAPSISDSMKYCRTNSINQRPRLSNGKFRRNESLRHGDQQQEQPFLRLKQGDHPDDQQTEYRH